MTVATPRVSRSPRLLDNSSRWVAGNLLRWSGRPEQNRRQLYDGKRGLRMLVFHDTGGYYLDRFCRVVEWCRGQFEMAGPEVLDALSGGHFEPGQRDQLLVTFDDGIEQHYDAACWLAEQGLCGVFFVIPSLLDHTVEQYLQFHSARGVEAFGIGDLNFVQPVRGLSRSQVREMAAMGHRIAGHNYAHRDLGRLHLREDLDYEIGRSLDELEELLDEPCRDFAFGFGSTKNVSDEALGYLQDRGVRVHSSVRGLNVPGVTSRTLLRDGVATLHPLAFNKLASIGGLDHRGAAGQRELLRRSGTLSPASPSS